MRVTKKDPACEQALDLWNRGGRLLRPFPGDEFRAGWKAALSELAADNERLREALEDAEDSFEQIYADLGEQRFNPAWTIDAVVQPALKKVRNSLTPQGTK